MNSTTSNPALRADEVAVSKKPRLLIAVMMFIVAVVLVGYCLAHPIHDFVEYWTAAHLLTAHQNPYSLGEVFTMERRAGFEQSVPIMLLSPPWALPLIAPDRVD